MSRSGAPSKACLYDKTHAMPTNAEHMMPNPPDLRSPRRADVRSMPTLNDVGKREIAVGQRRQTPSQLRENFLI
ncbi:hypothetical protein CEP51_011210 [Fusarium floridanum]|uniref:Uncharacterized protein n=1 Tax=Fusarium floridanum TaxID=1325733 RepID=A0A428RC09_9HYPO|nr:hypothetical protein CEP51_011210 [Fusarium floridanum]